MNKIAYLTIDDCPSEDTKCKLDYLLSKDIPAILFCLGKFLEKNMGYVFMRLRMVF